jgi:ParB family transcriptional regulator, chromosome partitioning protein
MSTGTEKTRRPLGRGLSSLLPPRPSTPAAPPTIPSKLLTGNTLTSLVLSIDKISPNPVQPRTMFRGDRLEELAASIRANGIIQPLIVRRVGEAFQIVAGERRWRAARLAGFTEVPVIVQDIADPQMLELALIENIQREDLNPIETAHAYDRLGRELGLSQEEIGRRTGKDRTSITNMIRLLRLPDEVQLLLAEHRLSTGHARAILALDSAEEQIRLAEKASAQGLSVRQVETLVQEATSDQPKRGGRPKREASQDPNVAAAVGEMERALGTRVRIIELTDQRGKIEIDYYSQAELDRLFQHIVGTGDGPK